jgi:23S rRNA (adenine2030-N6)-methyltransferase
MVTPLRDPTRLNGSGLVLINPPWTLEGELKVLLPALAKLLGREGADRYTLDWLASEAVR